MSCFQQQSEQVQHTTVEISTASQPVTMQINTPIKLYRAALNDDWKAVEDIFNRCPEYKSESISQREETALHIAAAANCTDFAKQLVDMMEAKDLTKQNVNGNTAFFLTAASGNVELAKEMMKKNSDLAKIRGSKKVSPLYMAAVYGHREMVSFLYEETKKELKEEEYCFQALIALLKCKLYDTALQVLNEHPYIIATVASEQEALEALELELKEALELQLELDGELKLENEQKVSKLLKSIETLKSPNEQKASQLQKALELLAQRPRRDSCFDKENEQGIWKRCIKIFSGDKVVQIKTFVQQEHDIKCLLNKIMMSDNKVIREKIGQLIFVATQQGNVEFLKMFIGLYPDLIWTCDDNGRSIFHIAVLHRQEDIFKLIHELGSIKNLIATYKDKENGNNMLHMAGLLAPTNRLDIVPGAALQLQRELLWFEEVKKIMQPLKAVEKNYKQKTSGDIFTKELKDLIKEGEKTPEDLFTREHKDLMKEGEKWMRETANSCMLVATLIATVVFAAAFTVPGGNKDQTGIPLFIERMSFKVFAVSDAISLLFSCTSILVFLSILTSRYAEKDFLWELPFKLIIGLVTLLISVAAMMVAFTATFFIVFYHGLPHFAIAVAAIASVPVILFVVLHWRLFRDIIRSTYKSRSMFQENKGTLFPKED